MSAGRVPESQWLKNFTKSAGELIEEQTAAGYKVQGFIMTMGIYEKLSQALGYDPTDLLGYVIEILEQTEDEYEKEGEMVLIKGQPLN
ncbi:MAG: hypothetical protein EBX40_00265 [Gammaproteobacteria bacterium]|nr:hypothetical protein [Gammaproteobacteria bacterium]